MKRTHRNKKMLKNGSMIKIRTDLCLGCGVCIRECPKGAIYLNHDHAEINYNRCNQCALCLNVCPQGAIVELFAISGGEPQATVTSLKQRANDLIGRIEKAKRDR